MKKSLFLLFGLIALAAFPLHASHGMGAEITYSCLNACTTRVYFKGYRDCAGASTINQNIAWVSPPGCTPPTALGATSTVVTIEVTPVCPGAPTQCTVPGAPTNGVQEKSSYRDYNTCAATPCVYTLRWSECCRNAAISSLTNPSSQSIALSDVRLNTALATCNNSPVFTNYPLFYACQGQNYTVHQGASDPDFDSLAYTMSPCYSSATAQVNYASGFSATAPLGPSWNVSLDPTSGMLTLGANPGNALVGVICINVQEFRNGQMIGQTQRDIQITTLNCGTNSNPTIAPLSNVSAGAGVSAYHVFADPGVPLCMDIATADADAAQTLMLTWSNLDNTTATFTDATNGSIQNIVTGTGANPPVGRLCWANPVYGTYHFKVRVEDSNCPVYGHSERFIVLHINQCNTPPVVTVAPMACPTVSFAGQGCFNYFNNYQWTGSGGLSSNQQNFVHTYPTTGNHTWQLIVTGPAGQADTVSGSITLLGGPAVLQPNILVGPYTVSLCGNGGTDTLDAGPGAGYLWSVAATTQKIGVSQPGIYHVTVTGFNGCESWDSTEVTYTAPDIDGIVTTSTGAPLMNEKVLLIKHDTTTQSLWAVDSAMTNNMGYYYFCNVVDTTVFLKATPLAANYPNEMPTYADTTLFWNNAISFTGVLQTPFTHNFSTLLGSNPGGPGFIGGLISQGANKMSGVGDPIIGLRVVLVDQATQDILGTTLTDGNGYFSFPNIPIGNYNIVPDRPLVSTTNVPLVSLTAQQPVRDSLDFQLHRYWLELVNTTVSASTPMPGMQFDASPNPFSKTTRINLQLPADADVTLDVYDVVGKRVAHLASGPLVADRYRFQVGEGLGAGIYFVRLQVNGKEQVIKILKAD